MNKEINNEAESTTRDEIEHLLWNSLYGFDDIYIRPFLQSYKRSSNKEGDLNYLKYQSNVTQKLSIISSVEFKMIVAKVLNFIKSEFENNIGILTELSKQEEAVQIIVKDDEKFNVFLRGIKVMFLVIENYKFSLEIVSKLDTEF